MTRSLSYKETIRENLDVIRENISAAAVKCGRNPREISVMAVTKTVPYETVNEAFKAGVTLLGENRVQEFREKLPFYEAPKEKIHFIGHLQTNKIRDIIENVSMIESVDSFRLAEAIEKECVKRSLVMKILLEVNIGNEATKSGFLKQDIPEVLRKLSAFENIEVCGLMAIPPRGESDKYFGEMNELFLLCKELKIGNPDIFETLSIGMSGDYQKAIAYGSTQIRLGRALFGERV